MRILKRPTVKWGNYAGLVVFTMEPAMIFLITLYLQKVLGLSPLATGLIFGVPGLASVAAGVIAGRFIGRFGSRAGPGRRPVRAGPGDAAAGVPRRRPDRRSRS